MQTCRLGRPRMRPVGCAQKSCGPGAVSQLRYANLSFSRSLKVVYASSRTRETVFLPPFCWPEKASVAALLGERPSSHVDHRSALQPAQRDYIALFLSLSGPLPESNRTSAFVRCPAPGTRRGLPKGRSRWSAAGGTQVRAAALGLRFFRPYPQPTQNEAFLHAAARFAGLLAIPSHPSAPVPSLGREHDGGVSHLTPSHLERARLALRQLGAAIDRQSLASKEFLFLRHKRRATRLRDDLWRWGIGEVKKTAKQREWGEVPGDVARALVECRRNRSDTRFHVPRLWDLWLLPLEQPDQDWDEMYVDESPEVSDSFARPGDARWVLSTPTLPSTGSPILPPT